MRSFVGLICLLVLVIPRIVLGDEKLVVHEWGTFTSFQDFTGDAIGAINADDEPVPSFVHRVGPNHLVVNSKRNAPTSIRTSQGAPHLLPAVTMRLETPVLYFYPFDVNGDLPKFDVSVKFNGGWITEYYPHAKVNGPGFPFKLNSKTGMPECFRWRRTAPLKLSSRVPCKM